MKEYASSVKSLCDGHNVSHTFNSKSCQKDINGVKVVHENLCGEAGSAHIEKTHITVVKSFTCTVMEFL